MTICFYTYIVLFQMTTVTEILIYMSILSGYAWSYQHKPRDKQ